MKKFLSTLLAALAAVTLAFGLSACKPNNSDNSHFTVYMPDGAPALSMARLMAQDDKKVEDTSLEYRVVASEAIQSYVTGANPAADICVLPVNLASKLLGSGEKYKMLGTVTHGNLYILSKKYSEEITTANLSSLNGKTVGVVKLADVPGLTLKVVLNDNGITYNEEGLNADSVYLKSISATDVGLLSEVDYYVAPEPAASTKANAVADLGIVGDLQQLYGGESGYPQAVLVAKNSVISFRDGAFVNAFMQEVADGAQWLLSAETTGQIIYDAVAAHLPDGASLSIDVNQLNNKTILSHCAIRFERAADCKAEVNGILSKFIAVDAQSAANVSDSFYYAV